MFQLSSCHGGPKAASPPRRQFARKVRASRWALLFERLWPRLWLILGRRRRVPARLARRPLADCPVRCTRRCSPPSRSPASPPLLHAVRMPFPSHEEAVRRIERVSGVPHRPASSYEDTITANADDPRTAAIWQAHRARLAAALSRLRSGRRTRAPTVGSDRPARAAGPRRRRAAGAGRRQRVRPSALRLPLQLGHRARRSAPRCLGDAAVLHGQPAADARRRRARPGIGRNAAQARRGARAQRADRAHQRQGTRRAVARRVRRGQRPSASTSKPRSRRPASRRRRTATSPRSATSCAPGGDPRALGRLGAGALGVLREARQGADHRHDQARRAHAAAAR